MAGESNDGGRDVPPETSHEESTVTSNSDRSATIDPVRVGDYKILRKVGEGGMGVVYEAEQERPVRRKVALKLALS